MSANPQAIHIAGTTLIHVERRATARQAETILQYAGRGGHEVIGRLRDEDQDVDAVPLPTEIIQQPIRRRKTEIRSAGRGANHVPLLHADVLADAVDLGLAEYTRIVCEREYALGHGTRYARDAHLVETSAGHGLLCSRLWARDGSHAGLPEGAHLFETLAVLGHFHDADLDRNLVQFQTSAAMLLQAAHEVGRWLVMI